VRQPGGADPIAHAELRRAFAQFIDDAHDLVSGHYEWATRCEVAFGEMKIGATHSAGNDVQAHLAETGRLAVPARLRTSGACQSGPASGRPTPASST